MEPVAPAEALLEKAEKLLRWSAACAAEMVAFGEQGSAAPVRIDDLERAFASALFFLASTHEAVRAAAKRMGRRSWVLHLDELRLSDPLLNYLWAARNSDTHDGVIAWRPGIHKVEYKVVDPVKFALVTRGFRTYRNQIDEMLRLQEFIYGGLTGAALNERIRNDPRPLPECVGKAGVEIPNVRHSLVLLPCSYRRRNDTVVIVQVPKTHLGRPIPNVADEAIHLGIEFYKSCLAQVRSGVDVKFDAEIDPGTWVAVKLGD